MITAILMAATAVASSSSLMIEGAVTYAWIWATAKGIKQSVRTNYTFKH